jgi:hypothetical protein
LEKLVSSPRNYNNIREMKFQNEIPTVIKARFFMGIPRAVRDRQHEPAPSTFTNL